MCCTIGDVEAVLTGTKIYVGEAILNGKYVHVLAYQNIAETPAGHPNAMVLPFPTDKPMTKNNVIPALGFRSFLDDIADASRERYLSRGLDDFDDIVLGCAVSMPPAQVFSAGSYTVILADHVAQIPEALTRVPNNQRPTIHTQFLLRYGAMYKKQPIAICCWNGYIEPEPLLWWYEPTNKGSLFIPTMDAHNGYAPDLEALVKTDHIISVGSNIDPTGDKVNYSDTIPDNVIQLLPSRVHGYRPPTMVKNGDMFVNIMEMKSKDYGLSIKRGSDIEHINFQDQMRGWS